MDFVDLKTQHNALRESVGRRIQQVLDHGQYILGPEVQELESALAQRVGARHCVGVASGTEALLIALMALGVGPGDEVITTPFTFVATVEVIALLGARPVFVDIEADTCNIDARKIEAAITEKTKAIIPVSLYGQVADMDEIGAIAQAHGGLAVIEDAAQSFGARYRGRASCNLSTFACTSFFPSKPLGCYGDGGALFTNDDDLAQACRQIRVHGQSQRYQHSRVGVGGRLDTMQAAVLLAKLERFDWEIAQRQRIGKAYAQRIAQACGDRVALPTVRDDRDCVWAQFTIKLDEREQVQSELKAAGVPTAIHYPRPLHLQPAYRDPAQSSFPVAEAVASKVLSLPMSADLSEADMERVVQALAQAVGAAG